MIVNGYVGLYEALAMRSMKAYPERPGDFSDHDGIIYCGKCGRPRRQFYDFPMRTADDPDRKKTIMVGIPCLCDEEEEAKEKQERQAEKEMALVRELRSASLMDTMMEQSTFSKFQETRENSYNLRLCRRYAEGFDDMLKKNQGLLFWGEVGTGKSFAAACIANYLLERKVPVIMTSFVKLVDALGFDTEENQKIINRINRAKLVIFDDLGAERCTDTAIERVYNIIDSRYRRCLPMILTTNRSPDDMQAEPDIRFRRIYDRVFATCYPMQFKGRSWRAKAAARSWDEMARFLGG